MILVRNRRPRLSGNKFFAIVTLVFIAAGACTPRAKVLRPDSTPDEGPDTPVAIPEPESSDEIPEAEIQRIVLLLPFELNRSAGDHQSDADVKRAALALDFYQGFEIGLEKQTEEGHNFRLDVLDSRDDEQEVARLSGFDAVQDARLVVGPIFPKGISAFAASAGLEDKGVLQVSPLAATMPTEFNIPNLVSMTPPIMTHVRALAARIAEVYRTGDVVLLYRTDEAASQQFIPALKEELRRLDEDMSIGEVDGEEQLLEQLRTNANNLLVCGSTNRFRVVTIVDQLRQQVDDAGYRIKLFGHPNWARMPFSSGIGLERMQTEISSSYYIDAGSAAVREFEQRYRSEFGVEPTDFSYKGYDAGRFFGELLALHGESYGQHLLGSEFRGLHNAFEFQYDPRWGYVNAAIHFLEFRNGAFIRTKGAAGR